MKTKLFSPVKFRELELKNRIVVSPMCMYSATDGVPNNWHLVHLGSRAVGGAGLVVCEATSVSPVGRISPADLGIWNQQQVEAFQPITGFIKSQNAVPAIQLAHAGRKATGVGTPIAPSAIPFSNSSAMPHAMTLSDLNQVLAEFETAAKHALQAGFLVAEIHMAHGYLLNEFLSPLSNHRTDEYGGSIENRMRFPLQVAQAIRKIWPENLPVFIRISATDWVSGGWTIEDSVVLSRKSKEIGIDLMDCSSGGSSPDAVIKSGPGYQVEFAERIRHGADIATGAVGMITDAHQAEEILQSSKADLIFIAREFLRDSYWPLHAATALGESVAWPKQYERAKPHP